MITVPGLPYCDDEARPGLTGTLGRLLKLRHSGRKYVYKHREGKNIQCL